MSPKVIVTGATGFLGRSVVESFEGSDWETVGIGFSQASGKIQKVDLLDDEAVVRLLDTEKPTAIIHCAANPSPDACANDPAGTLAINAELPGRLASLCAQRRTLLIYISTDYVFPGPPGAAPYAADAETAPPNAYGESKLKGEQLVLRNAGQPGQGGFGVVLRVPVLYGPGSEREGAINSLVGVLRKVQPVKVGDAPPETVKMDHWAQRYPTNNLDVGRVCRDVAELYALKTADDAKREELPRVLQFSSEDRMTKYEVCQVLAEVMGWSTEGLEPVTEGGGGGVKRPFNTHLSTKELKDLGIEVWTQDFKGWWRKNLNAFRH